VKLKLDENLPVRIARSLKALGHDADTAVEEGLAGRDDRVIWSAAQRAGRVLVTLDLDFSDLRRYVPGSHRGLILVRLRESGRLALNERLTWVFTHEEVETWNGCFVVITDRKVRVQRPRA
jgi:predicted nuclease of predicted toxin-antitoxin system